MKQGDLGEKKEQRREGTGQPKIHWLVHGREPDLLYPSLTFMRELRSYQLRRDIVISSAPAERMLPAFESRPNFLKP